MFILDPKFFHPGSRIRIKELKYFNPQQLFLRSRRYDPGCFSRVRIVIFHPSRIQGQKGTSSRIRIRNTGWKLDNCSLLSEEKMSRSGRKIKAKKRFIEELEQPSAKRPRSSLHPHSQVSNTYIFHKVGRVLSFFSSRRNWDSPNP
jgi:hypothetical protein